MARVRLFSKADKRAMKKLREETTPSDAEIKKYKEEKTKDCPKCNPGWFNGQSCADCGVKQAINKATL